MSIVKTYDVFCDGKDCVSWDDNASSGTKALAAKAAERHGWVAVGFKHFCPLCKDKPQESNHDNQ